MSTVIKERVHELVDRLTPSQAENLARIAEAMLTEVPAPVLPRNVQLRRQWLSNHEGELQAYRGQWILVEADGIVAADADHDVVWRHAKELGIEVPLMLRVWEDDLPFAGY
jgi:hypothetical protein